MPEVPALTLGVGDLTLELVDHRIRRGARQIELSSRELMLLKVLMREPGRVFTRTELCERVWEDPHNTTRTGGSFHRTLTTKMGDSPLIHTARHVGYTILRIKRLFRRAAKVTTMLPFRYCVRRRPFRFYNYENKRPCSK
jgi:DNA-binding response OmpR family regulator